MEEAEKLIGVWKLVEARVLDEDGNELPSPLGPQPMGVAIFDAERSMAMACNGSATWSPATKRALQPIAVPTPSTERNS